MLADLRQHDSSLVSTVRVAHAVRETHRDGG
jgi:hypothetical protein